MHIIQKVCIYLIQQTDRNLKNHIMTHLIMSNISESSQFVINHFINNKTYSLVFKADSKQELKLAGIKDAIESGYLTTVNVYNSLDIKVKATNKLISIYTY